MGLFPAVKGKWRLTNESSHKVHVTCLEHIHNILPHQISVLLPETLQRKRRKKLNLDKPHLPLLESICGTSPTHLYGIRHLTGIVRYSELGVILLHGWRIVARVAFVLPLELLIEGVVVCPWEAAGNRRNTNYM